MKILAIETSFDETSAAIVENTKEEVNLISQSTATSMALHGSTGGVIPEVAAREQIKYIIPVISDALKKAKISFDTHTPPGIDAIAVTYGPGLIGSLLVGVETVKTLSYLWNKPLIPVNHLFGHIYANWLRDSGDELWKVPSFPAIALIVSGAHTDLLLMKSHADITWLGGTRDDAAGEAFDKTGRLLHLPYPAGPKIEELAKDGNPNAFHFPRPLMYDKAYDFSFSGLKTAVLREVQKIQNINGQIVKDLSRGVQDAITDVLVSKTLKAAEEFGVQSVILSGGVAANETLRTAFQEMLDTKYQILHTKLFAPTKSLCTDNAAMIGAAAFFRDQQVHWDNVTANPELYFD